MAGIGFTVPLLIAELAFVTRPRLVAAAELGLFAGSAAAFVVGTAILFRAGGDAAVVSTSPVTGGGADGDTGEPPIAW